jgi:hypothetical protein
MLQATTDYRFARSFNYAASDPLSVQQPVPVPVCQVRPQIITKARGVEATQAFSFRRQRMSSGFEGAMKPNAEGAAESRQRRDG